MENQFTAALLKVSVCEIFSLLRNIKLVLPQMKASKLNTTNRFCCPWRTVVLTLTVPSSSCKDDLSIFPEIFVETTF